MNKYRIERLDGKTEDIEADGMQVDGERVAFFRQRPGLVMAGNPTGEPQITMFKCFNGWASVTDLSFTH